MRAIRIVLYVALAYTVVLTVLFFIQEKLLFQADELPLDYEFSIPFAHEEVFLDTPDGAAVHGVLLKASQTRGVVLYFHGNRNNITRWWQEAAYFLPYQYDVLVMDYRGYGKSRGERTEEHLYADALLAFDYLSEKYQETDLIVYGRSLGTGVATRVATERQPKGLILETPYHHLSDMLVDRYPLLLSSAFLAYNFNSEKHIQTVKCPVYIFHGTEDSVVPLRYGKKLAKKVQPDLLHFTELRDGQHDNLKDFDLYNKQMSRIFNP